MCQGQPDPSRDNDREREHIMSRCVAIQMDPIDSIKIDVDSTFLLGLEAQTRGHKLLHYHPNDLYYANGRIMAETRPMTLRHDASDWFSLGEPTLG